MSLNLIKHIVKVVTEAKKLEHIDINNKIDDSFYATYGKSILFTIITLLLIYLLENGFNEKFINLIFSSLSILIGLFITSLIFSFDKFYEPIKYENPNSREKLWENQDYNYSKIFSYITAYTILLSIFVLILVVPNTLELYKMNYNLNNLEFSFVNVNLDSITLFIKGTVLFTQRFLVIYCLIEILYNTLFIVSSMVNHIRAKIER